jgi:DNA-binding phage protein
MANANGKPMKGAVREEGQYVKYDDLRVALKRLARSKGGQAKHARRIEMDPTSLSLALSGKKNFSVTSLFGLVESLGMTLVLTPTKHLSKAPNASELEDDEH